MQVGRLSAIRTWKNVVSRFTVAFGARTEFAFVMPVHLAHRSPRSTQNPISCCH